MSTNKSQISIANYKKGAYIVVEGEKCDSNFFIIERGRVRLTKAMALAGMSNINLKPGDFFEVETALIGKKRLFNAVTIEDCRIIVVPRSQFNTLIQKKPSLVEKVILQFSQKVRKLDHILSSVTHAENKTEAPVANLCNIGNYYYKQDSFEKAMYMYYHYIKENPAGNEIETAKEYLEKCKSQMMDADTFLKTLESNQDTSETLASFKANQVIFAEGMIGDRMFFIQSGNVSICKIINNTEVALAVLHKGELFGEMALLESKPRSAIAIASSDCTLIVITNQNFVAIVRRDPSLITRITTVLASRIWFVYRQIANIVLPEGPDRLFDALLLFMEKQGLEKCLGQQNVALEVSSKEVVHFMSMDAKKAKEVLALFVKEKVINIVNDKIIVSNPQYVNNRATHIREQYEMGISRSES